ncbi:hypothetical protein Glove_48g110 [Diversispora epigaea]|uniref:Uncharacterized protein n=1 Tax=Diversispora epigaea TaxID=1348612 RepID=A0A397JE57_9GLOM|nr:hypothetical protein Glove_48g110 [Diversispora epigaea]
MSYCPEHSRGLYKEKYSGDFGFRSSDESTQNPDLIEIQNIQILMSYCPEHSRGLYKEKYSGDFGFRSSDESTQNPDLM